MPSQGIGFFEGFDESGNKCRVKGSMADVHKPLISASKCLGFGRFAVLDVNGGSLIPQGSKVEILEKASAAEQRNWIPVYQEQGVYNFYLRKPGYKPTKECCGIAELNATGERGDASMDSGRPDPEGHEEDDEWEMVDEVEKPIQMSTGGSNPGRDRRARGDRPCAVSELVPALHCRTGCRTAASDKVRGTEGQEPCAHSGDGLHVHVTGRCRGQASEADPRGER